MSARSQRAGKRPGESRRATGKGAGRPAGSPPTEGSPAEGSPAVGSPAEGSQRGSARRAGGDQQQRVSALLEPVVTGQGYDLEQVSVAAAGRRSLVRVVIDRDGGVSLDQVAELSRAIGAALDEEDAALGPAAYTLEVTSPGVDRPLSLPRHWRRNAGRLVKVRVGDAGLLGRIVSADEDGVVLDVDGDLQRHEHRTLGPGRIQVEFDRKNEQPDGGKA